MRSYRVLMSGTTEEKNHDHLWAFLRDAQARLPSMGYQPVSLAVVADEVVVEQPVPVLEQPPKEAAVHEVDFASAAAAELADELNLPAEAFSGLTPSGKTGFTLADVRRLKGDQ
jgi:hypothetical protein